MTLRFSLSEVKQTKDESGKSVIEIPIDIIMSKLPKAQRIKAEYSFKTKADVESEYAEKLRNVNWKNFAAMNFESTKGGYRNVRAYAKLLEGIAGVVDKYGSPLVNEAFGVINTPDKANIPYLKGVCRKSSERKEKADVGKVRAETDRRNDLSVFNKRFGAKMPAMPETAKAGNVFGQNQASLCL